MDITRHLLPTAALYGVHLALAPARQGHLPEVVDEDVLPLTGSEERTLTVRTGDRLEVRVYTGPTLTGIGTADLELERERARRLRAAADAYLAEIEAHLAARGRRS